MNHKDLPFREGDPAAVTTPPEPMSMPAFIGFVLLGDMVLMGVILSAVFMDWPGILWIIFGSMTAFILVIFRVAVQCIWNRMTAFWPAQPHLPDAESRRLQSFRIGLMSLAFSVNVTKDDDHLHLELALLFRLFGAKSMSLPWSSLEHRGAKHVRFKKTDMWGPAWAFEQPGDQSP